MIGLVDEMNGLDSEAIVERFLRSPQNPGIADPHHVPVEGAFVPTLLN